MKILLLIICLIFLAGCTKELAEDKLQISIGVQKEPGVKEISKGVEEIQVPENAVEIDEELAELIEKSKSGENRSLKDIWTDFRKKEVQVEVKMTKDISKPEPKPETISKKEEYKPTSEIKKASSEVEKIGDRIVKVQFTEYIGKRKKKVTHIEVTREELDEMFEKSDKPLQVQFSLF